tara:strand:+ start:73 stop:465 length:393 start_codon:yes stop_codon:yes gene_type:complete
MPGKKEVINPFTGNVVGVNPRITDEVRERLKKEKLNKARRMKRLRERLGKKDGGLAEAIEKVKAKEMEKGGEAVPSKFKGFSKLPEEVQKKMDPALAERFEDGGPVKMGSGGGVCKGMGIARAGGKFKIR